MSYCRKEGKDVIVFVTEDDQKEPSKVRLSAEDDPQSGPVLEDGGINWNCPCLGGMAAGPCGVEFRDAFSCFHYSTAEPKGSDCLEPFRGMSECMSQYPGVYGNKDSESEGNELDLNGDDDTVIKSSASKKETIQSDTQVSNKTDSLPSST